MMHLQPYGATGLVVSRLGLGAGQIGDASIGEQQAARVLNTALDLGITLIDTARGYGLSEERIGRHLAHRRSEFVLSTKVGYGIAGQTDWTPGVITAGVEEALRLLCTDFIDIVHLHSCELPVLQAGEVLGALLRAREQGKVGCVGYSGENAALAWAVADGRFGGVECSVNLFDQASLQLTLPTALQRGVGVIAKRPLGNAPWRFAQRPVGHYAETYWQRMHELAYAPHGMAWDELSLRFAAYMPEVSCAIVGTGSEQHLRHNLSLIQRGPLPAELVTALRERFRACGPDWGGEV